MIQDMAVETATVTPISLVDAYVLKNGEFPPSVYHHGHKKETVAMLPSALECQQFLSTGERRDRELPWKAIRYQQKSDQFNVVRTKDLMEFTMHLQLPHTFTWQESSTKGKEALLCMVKGDMITSQGRPYMTARCEETRVTWIELGYVRESASFEVVVGPQNIIYRTRRKDWTRKNDDVMR